MSTTSKEQLFPINLGIQTFNPEISGSGFYLSNLDNFRTNFNRLFPVRSHKEYYSLPGETVRGLAYVFDVGEQSLQFFLITKNKAYILGVDSDGKPSFSQVGTEYAWTRDHKVTWVSWDDEVDGVVYFTKEGTSLQRLSRSGLSTVTPTWVDPVTSTAEPLSARYSAVIQSRLVLANVTLPSAVHPRRVQWSDLNNPEDFEILPSKEADLFDLETGNLEITGLFNHRGYMTLFSRRGIWRAAYIGPPQVFRFEPVYSDFGNIYHHAGVSVKDSIYFIGNDNFYLMEGFTPRPIGDEIWPEWLESNITTVEQPIIGWANEEKREIFWKFTRKGRSDVPPGPIVVEGLSTYLPGQATLAYVGRKSGKEHWESGLDAIFWDNPQSRWYYARDGVKLLYSTSSDVFNTDNWYDVATQQLTSITSIRKGSWDYRTNEHECLLVYNYYEKHWSFRETQNMTEFYRNEYPVQATSVWGDFDEAWDNTGLTTAPVAWDDDPWDTRIWNGDWQVTSFPVTQLVGKDGGLFEYEKGGWLNNLNQPAYAEFRSHELIFGTSMGTKDLEQIKLTYSTVGDPRVEVEIGYRNNYSEPIRWTPTLRSKNVAGVEREFRFNPRQPGKLLTVRARFWNTDTDYVKEVVGGSLYLSGATSTGVEE